MTQDNTQNADDAAGFNMKRMDADGIAAYMAEQADKQE